MTITICGSMQFHKEMGEVRDELLSRGFVVFVPGELDDLEHNESYMSSDEERVTAKIEYDFIREHFHRIKDADAILVLNYEKKAAEKIKEELKENFSIEVNLEELKDILKHINYLDSIKG